jgi:PDZ domain-containing protein
MANAAIHAARVVKTVSDTQQPIVPPEPVVGVAPNPVHRFWAIPLASIGMLVLVAVLLGSFFTASRFSTIVRPYAIVPSDAEEVQSHISLEDVDRYPADGKILFVTIRQPELSLLTWLMFRHDDDISPRTYEDIYGTSTPQQLQTRGRRQMFNAQHAAEIVALSKLGFPVEKQPGAIIIDQIICFKASEDGRTCVDEAPSGKVLQPDDELVSVDGKPIDNVNDLSPILADHKPGDTVAVTYTRPGVDGDQEGEIQLIASPDDPTRTIIGFYPLDTTTISNPPFPIEFNLAGVGGPSAGLAFTLTLIDELTPGELTGGQAVAVTGEIDVDGNVGAIGGLAQKASAVRQTGTKYFIVPASQSPESLQAARDVVEGDVEIITVATLDEALAALGRIGGNADEIGTPGKDYHPAS